MTSTSPGVGGTETIKGGNGSDVLIAGPGNATISALDRAHLRRRRDRHALGNTPASMPQPITVQAAAQRHHHRGLRKRHNLCGPGNDIIHGGPGNDLINSGSTVAGSPSGYDQISGATSTDTLTDNFPSGIPANISHPTLTYQVTTDFTTGAPAAFSPAGGSWSVASGQYQASTNGTATSTYSLVTPQATFQEIQATVQSQHESGLVYDYISATNFKFVAIITTGQVILGHATAQGLVTDASVNATIRSGGTYVLSLTVSGSTVTAYLNDASINLKYAGYTGSLFGGHSGLFSTGGNGSFTDFVLRGNDPTLTLSFNPLHPASNTTAAPDSPAPSPQSVITTVITAAANPLPPSATPIHAARHAKRHHVRAARHTHPARIRPHQKPHAAAVHAKWSLADLKIHPLADHVHAY